VRVGLHREAGRRLARAGAPALQVAEHLARGAAPGDADAVDWLTRAAREAAPRSPGVAAELLERAIDLVDPADPARDRLVVECASSLWWAGRVSDAAAACRVLLDRVQDPRVDGLARLCLARVLVAQGLMAEALGELERAQQCSALTEGERSAAWAWAGMARVSLGDLEGAAAAATRGRSAAVRAGEHVPTSVALTSLAVVAECRGQLRRALQLIDEAVVRADRSPDRIGHRYPVHVTRGHILMELDRLEDARSTLESGRRISERIGARWALPSFQVFFAVERYLAGEWDDAVVEVDASVEQAEETGERYSLVLGFSVAALIALHRGDLRRAEEEAERGAAEVTASGPRFRSHWAAWARALVHEATGALPEAFATLADCWDECARSGLVIECPVLGPDLVRLALAAGNRDRAQQVTTAVANVAAVTGMDWVTAAALRCRGLLDDDPEPLLAAVRACARSPRPLALALTCEDAAAALIGSVAVDDARPLLDRALATLERLDAARDVDRVEARLRELGIRRGRRGPRKRPRAGWASLTPTERRVVDLVAEGLTNPQIGERLFLSRRTVQTHVAHVFAKVDVSSRAQLAAQATRRRRPAKR
jgi:DNA-binding CsgD family transcriptional regulator/tetratricopeptide (TPR) repeat protein